jgi:hypothetical protein
VRVRSAVRGCACSALRQLRKQCASKRVRRVVRRGAARRGRKREAIRRFCAAIISEPMSRPVFVHLLFDETAWPFSRAQTPARAETSPVEPMSVGTRSLMPRYPS